MGDATQSITTHLYVLCDVVSRYNPNYSEISVPRCLGGLGGCISTQPDSILFLLVPSYRTEVIVEL